MELSRLCEMQGISGREELVRMAIFRECAEVLGEENVKIDRTGNVIAHKACRKADAPRVMVAAHMDEVGLMVINAADDGLLQVRNIGGVDPRVLVSKRVKVGYDMPARDGKPAQEALSGVIGAMAIHLQSAADRKNVLPIENLSMIREVNILYHHSFKHAEILQDIVRIYNETAKSMRS